MVKQKVESDGENKESVEIKENKEKLKEVDDKRNFVATLRDSAIVLAIFLVIFTSCRNTLTW